MSYSRRELNKIESRKRILKASRRLFSAQGYEETMMEEIARQAEVSKATVYNYFPNKESLLIGIVDEVADRVEELLELNPADGSNCLQRVQIVLEEIVDASLQYPDLSRRIAYLNADRGSPLFGTWQEIETILMQLILTAQREGLLDAQADARDIQDRVMGIYLIALFQWTAQDLEKAGSLKAKLTRSFEALMEPYLTSSPT
ncbi:MAG: TetR/AcrR family transcriptional regulator [Saccharofermentanales bacterium]